ncbi:MAG: hypothetical protein CMP91_04550 [Gammaproteobacteria bacterium]|nr:hypothetical protein [Gammaproteobacteria bacterium]MAY03306.1 hypothetical protein [Gammaproteobacteria bacterium]|tara:strand:+ start:1011 stop:1403 length:393 start_codon:yes stop_codon:yes gene_type:complete
MFKRVFPQTIILISLGVFSMATSAHHSRAMFDFDSAMDLSGTVVQWQFTNPHVFIILEVTEADGSKSQWTLEGFGANSVYRQGWTPESLQPGDNIIVNVAPLFAGGTGGSYSNVRWADGTVYDPRDGRPE